MRKKGEGKGSNIKVDPNKRKNREKIEEAEKNSSQKNLCFGV